MNSAKKYLDKARNTANQGFNNADGTFNNPSNFGSNAFKGANGFQHNSASGAGSNPTSQPYVINITNASGAAVADFPIFGANQVLGNGGRWTNGSYTERDVTISSGTPNVTYQEMLYQFQQKPFSVGSTYINSPTATQVSQVFSVETKDANGNYSGRPIVPTVSPFQQQANIIVANQQYDIEGSTKIKIASILPNATIQMQFYPTDKVDVSNALAGQSVTQVYSDPTIGTAGQLVLKA